MTLNTNVIDIPAELQTLAGEIPNPDPFTWDIFFEDFAADWAAFNTAATSLYTSGQTDMGNGWIVHVSTSGGSAFIARRTSLSCGVSGHGGRRDTQYQASFAEFNTGTTANATLAAITRSERANNPGGGFVLGGGVRTIIRCAVGLRNDGHTTTSGFQAGLSTSNAFSSTAGGFIFYKNQGTRTPYIYVNDASGGTNQIEIQGSRDMYAGLWDMVGVYDDSTNTAWGWAQERARGELITFSPTRDGNLNIDTGLRAAIKLQAITQNANKIVPFDYIYAASEKKATVV